MLNLLIFKIWEQETSFSSSLDHFCLEIDMMLDERVLCMPFKEKFTLAIKLTLQAPPAKCEIR